MYADHPPVPNCQASRVLVLEESDNPYDVDAIIETAKRENAITQDGDGNTIYWIVFADNPKRVWDFTEKSLERSLKA